MSATPQFRTWLALQSKRDDRIGDVARDFNRDQDAPRNVHKVRAYLRNEAGASDACLAAFEAAIDEWQTDRRRLIGGGN